MLIRRIELCVQFVKLRTQHLLWGIRDVLSAARCLWQNPYAERVIGSIRRVLRDHVVVLNEAHARHLLLKYQRYYNANWTHLALGKDAPETHEVQGAEHGAKVIELREGFGLHHRYERRAASTLGPPNDTFVDPRVLHQPTCGRRTGGECPHAGREVLRRLRRA
ncbi:transposase [Corallococcus exercitus]|uniref:transposase n=1 Tax=Corallococcus exercitus TaxID=2316736 RepID=UPI001FC9D4D4|nr:transposase [Corallococcus exercitus]